MALQTDLNVAPYHDDFDPAKKYYRVLFQPSVALQARELNQLQSILQNQIEKFGDNIFKRGTIIEGCGVVLHSSLPYVKLKDTESDGAPVNIASYQNLYVKNSSNVNALIVKTEAGFESQSPNLNTLYVKYLNSGSDANTSAFSAGQTLTVYSPSYPIFKYVVTDGSSDFSNTDNVVITSAIAVTNSTGGNTFPAGAFSAGHTIQNGVANAVIIEANGTANSQVLILKIRPYANNLVASAGANSVLWRFSTGETIKSVTSANSANVVAVIGTGAVASLITDTLGKVTSISVVNSGEGYYVPPHVAIANNGSGVTAAKVAQLAVTAQNFKTTVPVAPSVNDPIGMGYGMTVNEGTVYQKGFFSKVDRQLVIVNKYSNTNFTKSVGFHTEESIIDSNQDQSLLDNATGTYNYAAPGADRLYLNPKLYVFEKSVADANSDFLPIIEFADGKPYKQNKKTVYNVIGDEMAKRTFEESGNYVLDQFNVTTKDSTAIADANNIFKIYIDPGKAYLQGYRVETAATYSANVDKGTSTESVNGATVKVSYGNFVEVNELVGYFRFNYADRVELYSAALDSVSSDKGVITASGTRIGYARMRNLILKSGSPGTKDAVYKLYLFDVEMDAGKNFADVRSVIYKDGGSISRGAADIVLSSAGTAVIQDAGREFNGLLVKAFDATKSATALKYTYRTINTSVTANTTGGISVAKPSADEYFPYSGEIAASVRNEVLVIPTANYKKNANAAGTVDATSGQSNLVGTTTTFTTEFKAGDFIQLANTTANVVTQISEVVNNTLMKTVSVVGTTITGNAVIYFPNNVPISLTRTGRSANVNSSTGALNVYLGTNLANSTGGSTSANVVMVYNVTANNVSPVAKNNNRNMYARLRLSDNSANNTGPWALGHPDAFRLRGVWKANTASVAKSFNANTGVNDSTDFITIANNPFANGDQVTYSNTGGTTVVGGLANGSSYYVVFANSTGLALASSFGGANINITANTVSENHTLTGSPLHFTENTYGVTDVTNDYYLDHNQNEDFLDVSYLYLKPQKTKPTANDSLLVKFDIFTTTGGAKSVSSYSINDGASLTTLVSSNTNINTMEIPELFGKNDVYYDLRDQIDFRPTVANTIPRLSDVSNNSIINPGGGTASDRISTGTEWKFPLPNSDVISNIQYYLGRRDRVILDTTGAFSVVKGVPNVLDAYPAEPKNAMTLQRLIIPPYPSLPQSMSEDMIKIIDTKVANEKYTNRRAINYRVTTTLTADQIADIQVKNYQMVDIAALERRIKDLEYYVTVTLVNIIANSRYVPSSGDELIDRYKFGTFVDPMVDTRYCESLHPEFYATIENDFLVPKRSEQVLEFEYEASPEFGGKTLYTLPYEEYTAISQLDATDGPITGTEQPPVSNTSGNVSIITTTQQIVCQYQNNVTTRYRNDEGTVYEEFQYVFSKLAGPARIYWGSRDNRGAVEIFQSLSENGPWTSITSSAIAYPIDNNTIIEESLTYGEFTRIESIGALERFSYGPVGGWLEEHFWMKWTHEPTLGQHIKVRVYKGDKGGKRSVPGSFTYKLCYPSDTQTNTVKVVTDPDSFDYVGIVHSVEPPNFTIIQGIERDITDLWNTSRGGGNITTVRKFVADSQLFIISVANLKPNTDHKFFIDGVDKTSLCKQIRISTDVATALRSDENGLLAFDYYYDAGINEATSDLEEQNKLVASVAGEKQFKVESTDGNSFAGGTITIKSYIVAAEVGGTQSTKPIGDKVDTETGSTDSASRTTGGGGGAVFVQDPSSRFNTIVNLNEFVNINFGDFTSITSGRSDELPDKSGVS